MEHFVRTRWWRRYGLHAGCLVLIKSKVSHRKSQTFFGWHPMKSRQPQKAFNLRIDRFKFQSRLNFSWVESQTSSPPASPPSPIVDQSRCPPKRVSGSMTLSTQGLSGLIALPSKHGSESITAPTRHPFAPGICLPREPVDHSRSRIGRMNKRAPHRGSEQNAPTQNRFAKR